MNSNSIKKTLRLASQDGDDREAVALILFSLKALSNKIKNSIKKTLRLGDEGDIHECGVFTREFGLLLVYFEFSLMNWGVYS
ncbi:hypothetical protein MRBL20_000957 [Peribacillus frigoritolerans]